MTTPRCTVKTLSEYSFPISTTPNMIKEITNIVFKTFVIFCFIHTVSKWSELQRILTSCPQDDDKESKCNAQSMITELFSIICAITNQSFTSVIELVRFVIYLGQQGTQWVRAKTLFDRLVVQQPWNGNN